MALLILAVGVVAVVFSKVQVHLVMAALAVQA
jgi:hypothetical protein